MIAGIAALSMSGVAMLGMITRMRLTHRGLDGIGSGLQFFGWDGNPFRFLACE